MRLLCFRCLCLCTFVLVQGICRAGTERRFSGGCEKCRKDFYQPHPGQERCLECPFGTQSRRKGATECEPCPKNTTLLHWGCGKCPPGEAPVEKFCYSCRENTFSGENGIDPCLPCPPYGFSNRGAAKCIICKPGEALMMDGKCGKCREGSYYDSFNHECRKCGQGEFMPYNNTNASCFKCAGSSFSKNGAKERIKCPMDEYLMKNGSCASCPDGFVYEESLFKCVRCRVNTYRAAPIFYCKKCPRGTFALPGSSTCFTCPKGTALIQNKRKCGVCRAGQEFVGATICQKCPFGKISSSPGLNEDCTDCPQGTKANKARTKCIPE